MKISFIVPTYNNELYIEKCIDSIINQETEIKYEIIVINDGSTDETEKLLKKYLERTNVIVVNQKNAGVGHC